MKKIRILALATDAYGAGGGIAQYNRDLFGALAQSANVKEVIVLPRKGQKTLGDLPPKVTQLAGCNGKAAYSLNVLLTAKRRGPFDIIFCGHLYMAPLAVLVSKLTGTPVWLQLHGIEAWSPPSSLQRWAAERVHFVTAVSRHTRRLFLSWANCNPEMVNVLPNTVDERFYPGPKPEALLDRYQLRGKKVLLTVSRLAASERYKGHDRVISALASFSSPTCEGSWEEDFTPQPFLKQKNTLLPHKWENKQKNKLLPHTWGRLGGGLGRRLSTSSPAMATTCRA